MYTHPNTFYMVIQLHNAMKNKSKMIFLSAGLLVSLLPLSAQDIGRDVEGSSNKQRTIKSRDSVSQALTAKTEFAQIEGRRIAYRKIGNGQPIVLCNRFRGVLDSWDPLFLDKLAQHFQVITFDYSGIGLSTLPQPNDSLTEVKDVLELVDYFKFDKIVLLGWSHGGKVAQTVAAYHPEIISHLVLIGTGPLGKSPYPSEKIFFDRALKPVNDFDDEVVLFFEPASNESATSARLTHDRIAKRTIDKDIDVTPDKFEKYFKSVAVFNSDEVGRQKLSSAAFPLLVISGDHDIVLPVENWYALNRLYKNMYIVTYPSAGHAPHHQHPLLAVNTITSFVHQVVK